MRLRCKRQWFPQRTRHRPHPHGYRKRELAEAWALDVEKCSLFMFVQPCKRMNNEYA